MVNRFIADVTFGTIKTAMLSPGLALRIKDIYHICSQANALRDQLNPLFLNGSMTSTSLHLSLLTTNSAQLVQCLHFLGFHSHTKLPARNHLIRLCSHSRFTVLHCRWGKEREATAEDSSVSSSRARLKSNTSLVNILRWLTIAWFMWQPLRISGGNVGKEWKSEKQ